MTDQTTWDLEDLLTLDDGEGAQEQPAEPEKRVAELLERADELAVGFSERYAGKVAELDGPGLLEAMTTLAEISELAGRALNFAHLRFAGDTADPEIGALLQSGSERATAIQTKLLFFELEWVALDDAKRRRAARDRGPRLRPPPPANRAPLSRPRPQPARGEDRHGAVSRRRLGLEPAL